MTATERQAEELEKTEDEVSRNLGEILDRSDDVGNKFNVSQHQHDIKKSLHRELKTSRLGGVKRVVRVEAQLRKFFLQESLNAFLLN